MTEVLSNFHFLRPHWLLLLLPCLLLGALLWRQRGQEASWSRIVAPELLEHLINRETLRKGRSGLPALLAAWIIAVLAAAGPSWQQLPQPVLQKQDALVLVLDLSYSMLATDLQPSRQDRVRRKLLDLLRERREGLTALIAYAGDAHIVAPLTDDNPTIANLLPALTPEMMPLPGSNPVEAVERALALLDSAGVRRGRILLVTDGIRIGDLAPLQNLLAGQPRDLAVLGVGTRVGAPIALPGGGFLKDESGEIVVPALDEEFLRNLTEDTGGRYRTMTVDDSDLQTLLSQTDRVDDDDTIALDRRADRWQDMAHWLVLPLLLVALGSFRKGWVYVLPLFVSVFPAQHSEAFEWQDLWLRADQQAKRALTEGDAERAAALFEDPAWRGTAAFRDKDYATAAASFGAEDSADAWYNRGNALAAEGELEAAINAYKQSLERAPDREDAQKNLAILEQLLEQQQQQEQQGEQGDSQQQPQDSDGNQEQQSGDGNQENQQSQQSQGNSGAQNSQPEGSSDQSQSESGNEQGDEEANSEQGSQGNSEQSEEASRRPMPQPTIDNSAMQEDLEKDQAMQQWLRRVPDDPSGLLREKFRFESRQRQQQGKRRDTKEIW
ncbi:VWA domain-containing protein [Congregibacter litoralis]|uniref:Tetratricopeptide repeat protein/von Willebrand factor type A domain protein n=1 Tax=Congregibacter litoralis KT71 TaxID=314285 RepID=A4A7X0_9GAMM|nr:VWA domain-containing protein [Congregibacter litoralis]EAQ97765.2 Tetratricopeptide repeat protein/von Willebrand factor type A domain protein [Congregibacter litoralis KT71]